jgi:ketosteroid isomerase-like protein
MQHNLGVRRKGAVDEAFIRRRVEDLAKAIRAKNIDGVMSVYAPNIVSSELTAGS